MRLICGVFLECSLNKYILINSNGPPGLETLKGVAALGNRYLLEPQSIGSCGSTPLIRGFGVFEFGVPQIGDTQIRGVAS